MRMQRLNSSLSGAYGVVLPMRWCRVLLVQAVC